MDPSILLSVCRDLRQAPLLVHTSRHDKGAARLRERVIAQGRFGRRCHYCDFAFGSSDLFEIHHLDHDHRNEDGDNTVPICELCHAPFHLDMVSRKWSGKGTKGTKGAPDEGRGGKIIFLPELSQPELNNLLQAIFFSQSGIKATGAIVLGGIAATVPARAIYDALFNRAALVEQNAKGDIVRAGFSEPFAISRVLAEVDDKQYAKRAEWLYGLRYLPPFDPFVERAREWSSGDCAFSRLDLGSWNGIAR